MQDQKIILIFYGSAFFFFFEIPFIFIIIYWGDNIYGKVRILSSTKIDDSPFREIASERVSGTDLYETVLMDIEFSRYDLESDSSPDLQMLGEITPNYSEGKILQSLGDSIGTVIKAEIPWTSSQVSKMVSDSDGSMFNSSTYLCSYAFLIVDDFHEFYRLVTDELVSEGVSYQTHNYPFAQEIQKGVLEIRLRTPIKQIPVAHMEYQTAPVYLWVLEKSSLGHFMFSMPVAGDNQQDRRIYHSVRDSRAQRDHMLQINRLRVIRNTLAWAGGECTRILETLPDGLIESDIGLEKRTKKHLELWESLSIIRSTQLLLQDFVIHENPIDVSKSTHDPNLTRDKIELRLSVLGQRLDSLEKTVQTRLNFSREQLQAKSQERFNKATIFLGLLVLFEIIASYLTWFYPQGNLIGNIVWIVFIVTLSVLVFTRIEDLFQYEDKENRIDTSDKSRGLKRMKCPHCNAIYSYDINNQEVICQNCAKPFQQPH